MIRGLLIAVGAVLVLGASAPVSTALTLSSRQDITNGRELYVNAGCPACHGDRAQGFIGPRLAGLRLSYDDALTVLREPSGGMLRYDESAVSGEEFLDIYTYLRDLGGL